MVLPNAANCFLKPSNSVGNWLLQKVAIMINMLKQPLLSYILYLPDTDLATCSWINLAALDEVFITSTMVAFKYSIVARSWIVATKERDFLISLARSTRPS
jgi:hypothetical protein